MLTLVKATMDKVTLVLFSVVITLLLLEFTIRLFSPQAINLYNFTLIQSNGSGEITTCDS